MADKQPKPPQVLVYCDARDMSYWYQVGQRFLKMGAKDIRMHFRFTHGLRDDIYHQGLREIDYPLVQAQLNRVVDYAGPLAGHMVGAHRNSSGGVFLVTQQIEIFKDQEKKTAKPKSPKFFSSFIEELLPGDQWILFCHWLRIALESLQAGDFRPGQVVVLAGPSECGKSLLQTILTEIIGGRKANPFAYMMGEKFNYDLAGAEHWCIEDPATTTDIRARRFFGAKLKEATVNSQISINQKGKDALLLTIFRRVTISVNDEPENLAVIPPLDDSIKDKIFVFKCNRVVEALAPFKDKDGNLDRKKLLETINGEMKAIRTWLVGGLVPLPKNCRNTRFGIAAWQHPDLLSALSDLSPESRLLTLLDEVLFERGDDGVTTDFQGKSVEMERKLRDGKFSFEADKLLRYPGACGVYLARLSKQHPERISKRLVDGYTVWIIKKPSPKKDNHE